MSTPLAEAAARFLRAAPWHALEDEGPFLVNVPTLGISSGVLVVTGDPEGGDEEPGFVLFEEMDHFLDYVDSLDDDEPVAVPGLQVDLAPAVLTRFGAGGAVVDSDERDVALATACAHAVVDFLERHPQRADDSVEISERSQHADLPDVELVLRHPDLEDEAESFIRAFVEQEQQHVGAELAEIVVVHALNFMDEMEEDPFAWSPALVEAFLLGYVPREAAASEAGLLAIPRSFGRLLAFIGAESGPEDERRVRKLHDRIDAIEARYRQAIASSTPDKWSLEKRVGMRALAEGIDPEDDAAWAALEARVKAEPVAVPVVAPKVGRNDPCPCGSGKKHKKCCAG